MSDYSDYDGARTQLILAVYGESPRSVRARANITKALGERGMDPATIRTVDVMAEPERALEMRTVAAPQLIIGSLESDRSLYGDLSDRERLDRWLDEMLATGKGGPAKTL